ncbi:MAG: replicative DNA helicase [Abditibacteriota bacterium]|nr:replicative DNA helicase [Abditibacteriota bacterium]
MTPTNVHVPPNNIDAEKSVLGCMLMDNSNDSVLAAIDILKPKDFYFPAHQEIYSAMLSLSADRIPVDLITLQNELQKRNKLDVVGGISYLTELTELVPTTSNISIYINIVEEKSLLRQLINASTKMTTMAYGEDENARNIIEKSEALIYNIANTGAKNDFKDMKSLILETYDWIDQRIKNKGTPPGLDTGFTKLDYMTGGLQKGELIILAARPSEGKTALAMNIALNCAKKSNAYVAVFSLEMSAESLTQRLVASEARADMSTFKKGDFDQTELDKIVNAASRIHYTNIFIDDSNTITPINMLTKARKLKNEQGKIDLIVIDYLQYIKPPREVRDNNRVQEVAEISKAVKSLAREMNCPVLCLSQMSRDIEKRKGKPTLSDLRESGAIEQDADIVMFLYRPNKQTYQEKLDSGEINNEQGEDCELIIAKHRNGPTGSIPLKFSREFVTFYSVDETHEE